MAPKTVDCPSRYEQFEEYGIHRQAIPPAIRELVALGFIGYDKGKHGEGIYHVPNKFRLTYRGLDGERGDGSHEWRRIKTLEDAEEIAVAARNVKKRKARKSISPVVENVNSEGWNPPLEFKSPVVETTPTGPVVEITPTSIFRDIVEGDGGPSVSPEPAEPPRPKPRKPYGSTKRNMPPAPVMLAA